jgi:hypothetical protein
MATEIWRCHICSAPFPTKAERDAHKLAVHGPDPPGHEK